LSGSQSHSSNNAATAPGEYARVIPAFLPVPALPTLTERESRNANRKNLDGDDDNVTDRDRTRRADAKLRDNPGGDFTL